MLLPIFLFLLFDQIFTSEFDIYLYENEYTHLDLSKYFPDQAFSFKDHQCILNGTQLIDIKYSMINIDPISDTLNWPNSQILKTVYFESGNLTSITGIMMTQNLTLIVFKDTSYDYKNIPPHLEKQSEYNLKYDQCDDITVYNQILFILCRNASKYYLSFYRIYFEQNYQLELVGETSLIEIQKKFNETFNLQINPSYIILYPKHRQVIYIYLYNEMNHMIDYFGSANITKVFAAKWRLSIERIKFLFYIENTELIKYIAILESHSGLLIGKIKADVILDYYQNINFIPNDTYLYFSTKYNDNINIVIVFIISSHYVIEAALTFYQSFEVNIINKQYINHIRNPKYYQIDINYYYYTFYNEITLMNQLYVIDKKTLNVKLHLQNLTQASFIAYSINSILINKYRSRLRVFYFEEGKVLTYSFYTSQVNLTVVGTLPALNYYNCNVEFYSPSNKIKFNIVVIKQNFNELIISQKSIINQYIGLEVLKNLSDYVNGPSPQFTIQESQNASFYDELYNNYTIMKKLKLQGQIIFKKIIMYTPKEIEKQKTFIIVVQNQNKVTLIGVWKELSGEEIVFDSIKQTLNKTIMDCQIFQSTLFISYQIGNNYVDIYNLQELEFEESYTPKIFIQDFQYNFFFKINSLFSNLITIIQGKNTKQIQLQIKALMSSPAIQIPEINTNFVSEYLFEDFRVEFLNLGILFARTATFFYQIGIDFYMKTGKIDYPNHPVNSSVIHYGELSQQDTLIAQISQQIRIYELFSLYDLNLFTFIYCRTLPLFGFQLIENQSTIINDIILVKAIKNKRKYILAYKMHSTNYNSLRNIIELDDNLEYFFLQDSIINSDSNDYCFASIDKSQNINLNCYKETVMHLILESKSQKNDLKISIQMSNKLNIDKMNQFELTLNFLYENTNLDMKNERIYYSPNQTFLLENYFTGPIQDCNYQINGVNQTLTYFNTNYKTVKFNIPDMCGRIGEAVTSKSWLIINCFKSTWVIQNNRNHVIQIYNESFMNIWGNPIKLFQTTQKWIIIAKDKYGFKRYIKQSESWVAEFESFNLIDNEGEYIDTDYVTSKNIIQYFVFYDIQTKTEIDFVLFKGYSFSEEDDNTIGIFLSKYGEINHTQIYQFSATELKIKSLNAKQINASCIEKLGKDTYIFLLTFQCDQRYIYFTRILINDVTLSILQVEFIDLRQKLNENNWIQDYNKIFYYELLNIEKEKISFLLTTDTVVVKFVAQNSSISIFNVYSDYLGCKNIEMVNRYLDFLIVACKYDSINQLYLKVYYTSQSPVINISQFIELPIELPTESEQNRFVDRVGYNYEVLQYGILEQQNPLNEITNFTYYFYEIQDSLKLNLNHNYSKTSLCCKNSFKQQCIHLIQYDYQEDIFWGLIIAPILFSIILIITGILYIKYYKHKMINWAQNYKELKARNAV